VALMLLAACETPAPPPPPVAPPPPPAPSVNFSPRLIEYAAAYRGYVRRASGISPGFQNGAEVAQGVRTGAAYQPDQMVKGMIAYGAIAAIQDPAFFASLRTFAADTATRQKVAYEILKDPAYVVGIPGSNSAAARVITALGDDGLVLYGAGKAVKQAAYDVQRQKWSTADVPAREARLAQAKSLALTPTAGEMAETQSLLQQATGPQPAAPLTQPINPGAPTVQPTAATQAPQPVAPPYTNLDIRALAIGALAALGEAGDDKVDHLLLLMVDYVAPNCMNMAKLNLYQCLAVAKPHYEDVFCLGQHAIMDTSMCLVKSAGAPEPLDVAPPPLEIAETQAGAQPVGAARITPAAPVTNPR
jgi:hypothetical protein